MLGYALHDFLLSACFRMKFYCFINTRSCSSPTSAASRSSAWPAATSTAKRLTSPPYLLAVLEGIADGSIQGNRIGITPELIAAFKAICTDLGTSALFTAANFALPFYHLRSDSFWHLHT